MLGTMNIETNQTDYQRIAAAIHYLEHNYQTQPTLDELADHLHLSSFHLQRLFTRWAGVSPKRFLQYLTVGHAKALLQEEESVLDATYGSGLSSPGRLHDLMIVTEAVTPGEYKSGGAGVCIAYDRMTTPFGDALIAVTERGICALSFVDDEIPDRSWSHTVAELRQRWQAATLIEDSTIVAPHATTISAAIQGEEVGPIPLLLKGTNFQLKVWDALLRIPAGGTCSYSNVAEAIGQPSASRAVGNAVGNNTIGYLIPCHRVIRKSGILEGYHWGATRKKAILAWEAMHSERAQQVA